MRLLLAIPLLLVTLASGPVSAQAQDDRVIIFFAWDRPAIDGDAAARLDQVAAAFASQPNVRLQLSGHADRSGPAGPNVQSGRKRAEAVRDYLAARGVAAAAMTVESHGEARPLIPTADGVREPQNRRVEIVTMPASVG